MSGTLRLRGATSGYSELQAPAVAADQTFILPTAGGTLLTTDSPLERLTLQLGSASQPSLTFEGDTDTGLFSQGTNTLNLVTGGSSKVVLGADAHTIYAGTGASVRALDIDSSGRLLVGTSSSINFIGSTSAGLQAINTSTQYALGMERATNDTAGPVCVFRKTRSTSNGGNTIVSSGDDLGYIRFSGTDGSGARSAAEIKASVDGTPGASDMPGRLVFSTTADGASSVTERMRIDSSGNVGIGIANPGYRLEIEATANDIARFTGANSGNIVFRNATSNEIILHTGTSDALIFGTNGNNERMRIDSSGSVGIGTSSPAAPLHVDSDNDYGSVVLSRDGGVAGRRPFGIGISGGADDHLRISSSSDTTGANAFANQIIEITSEGNVGIGTSSPSQILELKTSEPRICLNGTTDNSDKGIEFEHNGTRRAHLFHNNSNGQLTLSSGEGGNGYSIRFDTDGSERMIIDSSGRILIGTTNAVAFGSRQVLAVTNGTTGGVISLYNSTTATNNTRISSNPTGSEINDIGIHAASTNGSIRFYTNNDTEAGVIDSSGNLDFEKAVRGGTTTATGFFSGDFRSNATAASGFGALYAQNNQSGGRVWTGANAAGSYTSEIFEDGSAKFDGSVSIGGDAAANTIDEYEEGTWTPSIGGNATYTTQEGNYIKIGHLVLAHFRLGINSQGTGSTSGSIQGLPFNSAKAAQNTSALTFGNLGVSIAWGVYYVGANSSTMYFSYTTGAQAGVSNNPNIFTNNGASINGTLMYIST